MSRRLWNRVINGVVDASTHVKVEKAKESSEKALSSVKDGASGDGSGAVQILEATLGNS